MANIFIPFHLLCHKSPYYVNVGNYTLVSLEFAFVISSHVLVILKNKYCHPLFITARKRSLGYGNVFRSVCHYVHGGVSLCMMSLLVWLAGPMFLLGGLCLWCHVPSKWRASVQGRLCRENPPETEKREVHNLLECFLVLYRIITRHAWFEDQQ